MTMQTNREIEVVRYIKGVGQRYMIPAFSEVEWDAAQLASGQVEIYITDPYMDGKAMLLYDSLREFKEEFNLI